jgi:2-polyprenyl-3-methyl-5-hydroxy-6-metoxy-1,4-benzoquinol methylase
VDTIEHAANQQAVLSEAARVLKQGGVCFLSTANRFSLGPEPCVRVWGVGFLPRALASRYVAIVKGRPYRHIRLLSASELRRGLSGAEFQSWTISPARIAAW